ncbi:glycosyltransferase family protein [Desulfovibrio intestinalis]|uniref:Spore protein YkvP/CgeB glycosyl transferase-like domain-containing protein n=1 Tax=Desulfovibrio intestinalis TaxID=58621 RepID=A0A7W8C0R8_9BACT|nr:DUF3880 domain-containing protein [Desulfovibrio intestinalis]MBB5143161.1 hypothetical protein [Desulfovibrio intestinalis]
MNADRASRPQRISLPDFFGRKLTLPEGQESWRRAGEGEDALVLGLGPGCPWQTSLAAGARAVYWLEHEPTLQSLPALNERDGAGPPDHWKKVSQEEAVALAAQCVCFFYGPGMRLAPDFWGPLLGRVDAALLGAPELTKDNSPENSTALAPPDAANVDSPACLASRKGRGESRGFVLLPGHDGQLLHQELVQALDSCGLHPVSAVPDAFQAHVDVHAVWRDILRQGKPRLVLSVNLRGLDAEGRVFHLCQGMGIPVALWLVDNPWHVLSALRLPWWREAHIFVTDASFVPELVAAGARHAHHMPLAVAPHMWRQAAPDFLAAPEPLFVGRSAFPEKERFFAAAKVPDGMLAEALALLECDETPARGPNYFWWQQMLGRASWPDPAIRSAGLGAEACACANRVRWLRTILEERASSFAETNIDPGVSPSVNPNVGSVSVPTVELARPSMRIVGDAGWRELLPGANIQPPVDYYSALPGLYAQAAVVNVTSLLLPHSLSQRHFDVWAAGGLLFSDATPGLDLFPEDLAEAVRLDAPKDFWPRWDTVCSRPAYARDLRLAWREHLRGGHEYRHRVRRICELMGIAADGV